MLKFLHSRSSRQREDQAGGVFSFLVADIHSHFIPAIDDGSPDLDTSLELIQGLKALGFQKIVTTPHVILDYYPNSSEAILKGLDILKEFLKERELEIEIRAGAEYFMDEHFEKLLKRGDLLPVTGKEILVEMSFMAAPLNLHNILFEIQTKGFVPILAHPERYGFYHHQFEQYFRLKEIGCKLQLNLNSFTGYYGKAVKEIALKLLENNLVDYLGTDMHHVKHLKALQSLLRSRELMDKLKKHPFLNATL